MPAPLTRLIPCLCVLTLLGCGEDDPLNRQAVSGKVTIDSSPVEFGSIEFNPTGPNGVMSGAMISQGEYHIPADKGLPPGEYLIRIYAPSEKTEVIEQAPGEMTRAAKELAPPEYNTKTTQKRTVEAGKDNVFDFAMPKAPGK
ncbi:hypothetical protein Pan44_22820 [Caulifigura coniformis]|uniref:Carboxypeptidase regulatory-like domain-containing protein n=1 Tax=Caulifigura coniformis TaxID=2527983 RepID=A0A517SDQ3_9PLAN|nr:carboxypeptidase-like regulatory domain-containing protein [Caulifigura coniformis]QDT54254.1 hypothetical protein Pan44_22820 [Caulifigura coniformis]